MSSLSFVQRTFDWDGGNVFVWEGRCRDWGTVAPQVNVIKTPDFKTNTGALQHIGFDPCFRINILSVCSLHSHISCFFRLAYQYRATKHKN